MLDMSIGSGADDRAGAESVSRRDCGMLPFITISVPRHRANMLSDLPRRSLPIDETDQLVAHAQDAWASISRKRRMIAVSRLNRLLLG